MFLFLFLFLSLCLFLVMMKKGSFFISLTKRLPVKDFIVLEAELQRTYIAHSTLFFLSCTFDCFIYFFIYSSIYLFFIILFLKLLKFLFLMEVYFISFNKLFFYDLFISHIYCLTHFFMIYLLLFIFIC